MVNNFFYQIQYDTKLFLLSNSDSQLLIIPLKYSQPIMISKFDCKNH